MSTTARPPKSPLPALPRSLGTVRGLALSLGVVVGAGIFVSPAYIAPLLPHARDFLLVWILGGVMSLCSAFCYAELATAFPKTGGYVVYLREVYGDRLAFVYGWALTFVLYPSSVAGIALVFGNSLGDVLGVEVETMWFAVALIGAATAINVAGVRGSSGVQTLLTATKVLALLALAVVALTRAPDPTRIADIVPATAGFDLGAWFLALVFVSYSYAGYLEVVVVAGEVQRPAQTLGRVLVSSVVLISVVYVVYAWGLVRQLGMGGIADSPAAATDLARVLGGSTGAQLINVAIVVATGSAVVSLLMSGPRILVGLAESGLFFERAAFVHPKTATPLWAVLGAGVVAAAYATVGTFGELVKYFEFSTGLFSLLIVAGGLWLRRTGRIDPSDRRIPLWPLPAIVSLLISLGVVAYVFDDQPRASLMGVGIMLVALPLSRFLSSRPDTPKR